MSLFFYLKMNAYKDFFQNITQYISKVLPSSNNTYFKRYFSQFLRK